MRAVVVSALSAWMALACGGRTMDGGTYDEGGGGSPTVPPGGGSGARAGGDPGPGGRPNGGSAGGSAGMSGGSLGRGGSGVPAGGPGKAGSSSGGFGGGSAGVGGFAGGSGGVPWVEDCAIFCKAYGDVCPNEFVDAVGSFAECAAACSADVIQGGPMCEPPARDALTCVTKALYGGSARDCGPAIEDAAFNCAVQLERSESCQNDQCFTSGSVTPGACDVYSVCNGQTYELSCTGTTTGHTFCDCIVNGQVSFSALAEGVVPEDYCWDPAIALGCSP